MILTKIPCQMPACGGLLVRDSFTGQAGERHSDERCYKCGRGPKRLWIVKDEQTEVPDWDGLKDATRAQMKLL